MIEIEREAALLPPAKSFTLCEPDGEAFLTAVADDSDQSVYIKPNGYFWVWLKGDGGCMTIDELIEGLQALKARWED